MYLHWAVAVLCSIVLSTEAFHRSLDGHWDGPYVSAAHSEFNTIGPRGGVQFAHNSPGGGVNFAHMSPSGRMSFANKRPVGMRFRPRFLRPARFWRRPYGRYWDYDYPYGGYSDYDYPYGGYRSGYGPDNNVGIGPIGPGSNVRVNVGRRGYPY